jgi:hypothetical protein
VILCYTEKEGKFPEIPIFPKGLVHQEDQEAGEKEAGGRRQGAGGRGQGV